MRYEKLFWSLYFLLILIVCLVSALCHNFLHLTSTITFGTIFFTITLTVAIVMPYQKAYMNYLDIFLLSILTLWSYNIIMLSSGYNNYNNTLLMDKILLETPIVVLVLIALKKIRNVVTWIRGSYLRNIVQKTQNYKSPVTFELTQGSLVDTATGTQPLIHPTCTVIHRVRFRSRFILTYYYCVSL